MTAAITGNANLLSAQVGAIHWTCSLNQEPCGAWLRALRVLLVLFVAPKSEREVGRRA